MNEANIQDSMFAWLCGKKHEFITPNVRLFGQNESDIISVTRSKFIVEHEIKISRDDFTAEFRRKVQKHFKLSNAFYFKGEVPNYFNFVVPADLYANWNDDPVPAYAGLAVVEKGGRVRQVKAAKCLHRQKASDRDISYLGRGLMFRYWAERVQEGTEPHGF